MVIPHFTDEYACAFCKTVLKSIDIQQNWKCPSCFNPINIRIVTNDKDNSCSRISASELKVDDIILIHRDDDFRRIFRITNFETSLRLNIEKYGGWKVNKEQFILRLNGAWC